jgi:hypothetical protein
MMLPNPLVPSSRSPACKWAEAFMLSSCGRHHPAPIAKRRTIDFVQMQKIRVALW